MEDPQTFAALLAYSPYHNVVDGSSYPAMLMTAGENDSRVDAWHAKKMTARLQAATSSGRPVLLRLAATGHLAGSLDQVVDETTDLTPSSSTSSVSATTSSVPSDVPAYGLGRVAK